MLSKGRCNGYGHVGEFVGSGCRISIFAQDGFAAMSEDPVTFQIKVKGLWTYNLHGQAPISEVLSILGELPTPSQMTDKLFGSLTNSAVYMTSDQAKMLGRHSVRKWVVTVIDVSPSSPLLRSEEYRLADIVTGRRNRFGFDAMVANEDRKPPELGRSFREELEFLGVAMPETHEQVCELYRWMGSPDHEIDQIDLDYRRQLAQADARLEPQGPQF